MKLSTLLLIVGGLILGYLLFQALVYTATGHMMFIPYADSFWFVVAMIGWFCLCAGAGMKVK